MAEKIWFVTGASRGFGRVWTEAALERGDKVVATARDVASLNDLARDHGDSILTLPLDVTERAATFAAVERARAHFGRIDVVLSNAGHGLFGAVEELSEDQARQEVDVNLFGALWVLQAVAPILRGQGGGHVLITSSFGGLVSFPAAGLYGASKYAVEGLGESFAQETRHLGIKVTLVEPGPYATGFMDSSSQGTALPDYDEARARTGEAFEAMSPGDPAHTTDAILRLVDMDEPPLRLLLGSHALPYVQGQYRQRLEEWQSWSDVSKSAQ